MLAQALSGEPLVFPPNITITHPVNKTTYASTSIDFNFTSNETLVNASYDLDNSGNVSLGGIGELCYQETANVSTACGGLATGKYSFSSNWGDSVTAGITNTAIDGDWMTFGGRSAEGYAYFYINYTKPANASNSSLLQVKHKTSYFPYYEILNLTIPQDCWNYDSTLISFRFKVPVTGGSWQCYNGTGNAFDTIYTTDPITGGTDVYEEAMWWNITGPQNTTLSLSEGLHNITIYGENNNSQIGQSTYVYFTINQTPQWNNNQTNLTANTQLNDSVQFNVTLTDNFNLSSYTFSWNVSGFWENLSTVNYTITTTNSTLIENRTINQSTGKNKAWTVYFNDSIGNTNQTEVFNFTIKNLKPVVASATISPATPTDLEDLTCNNGATSDADDDTVSLLYNWTKNSIDQAISTQVLGNALTTAGDIWICKITPFDGYENGSTVSSASVSIDTGFTAPIINWTNSTPLTAELLKGQWLNLSVNFTDTNEDPFENHTAYFCKADSADTDGCIGDAWCNSSINVTGNYTSCRLDITNSSEFSLQEYTFYTYIVDNSSLISASKSNTFTIQDITAPVIKNFNFSTFSITTGNTIILIINISENVSSLSTIKFNLTNPNKVNLQRLNPTHFTLPSATSLIFNYTIFESVETPVIGTWNLTYISVKDNQTNLIELYPNITFVVTSAPTGAPVGGGPPSETVVNITNVTTIITEKGCNYNGICEIERGEDWWNCNVRAGGDCKFETNSLNPFCIFDENAQCIYKFAFIPRLTGLIIIIATIFLIFSSNKDLEKFKKKIKDILPRGGTNGR